MVALVVLSIGVLALGQLFIVGQRQSTSSRMETTVVSLGQEIRERIYSEPFDNVRMTFDNVDTDNPGTVTLPCQSWANHLVQQLGPNARGQIEVRTHLQDASLVDGMLRVDVTITWPDGQTTRQHTVRFVLCKVGL